MSLINTADKIYLGGNLASAVYAGATKVWPPAPPSGGPAFHALTSYEPPYFRNDFDGDVGVGFNVPTDTTFSWLGCLVAPGNTGNHTVRLHNYDVGTTPLRTATVNMTGVPAYSYAWVPIAPITLVPSVYYTLTIPAVVGGEAWGQLGPTTFQSVVNNINSIYRSPGGNFNPVTLDTQYVGLDLGWDASAWAPDQLSGLEVWLDAAQLGLADGATVSAWPNLGSGVQPYILTGGPAMTMEANAANGKPVVRFYSGGARLRSTINVGHNFTLVYVTRRWGAANGRSFTVPTPWGNGIIGMHGVGMDCAYDQGFITLGTPWDDTVLPNPWRLYGYDSDGVASNRFFVDGTVMGTRDGGEGYSVGWGISGYTNDDTQETMDCDVAELVIYNRKLSDAERIQVEDYLRTKWGL